MTSFKCLNHERLITGAACNEIFVYPAEKLRFTSAAESWTTFRFFPMSSFFKIIWDGLAARSWFKMNDSDEVSW